MENMEINITYEILFGIYQKEKDSWDLQKLDSSFFDDCANYLNEKKQFLRKDNPMSAQTEKQIENAKRLIKKIYEAREEKILDMALMKSRTESNIIDMSTLLEKEKLFFDEVVSILDKFRNNIINRIINEVI